MSSLEGSSENWPDMLVLQQDVEWTKRYMY